MADFFGDSSLFEEFDKDRDTESSYIHYEQESVRSRIVFESYDSENESDSDDDAHETPPKGQVAANAGPPAADGSNVKVDENNDVQQKGESGEEASKDSVKDSSSTEATVKDQANGQSKSKDGAEDPTTSKSSGSASATPDGANHSHSMDPKSAEQTRSSNKENEREETTTSSLFDQLYAEAGEEAKSGNLNVQQLVFDKNKYKRYANILDSTRYVPDAESPAVQLLFNNNSFARKYRQQIEQFIKGLLWEEFHTNNNPDNVPEITAKPGAPSCVEINSSIPPENRTEAMRQRHTILGNSQFHKQFLIDSLGWPFTTNEPTRCNQNWEIPLYGQVFDEVYADPSNAKKPSSKSGGRSKPSCWNCSQENHSVAECKQPRNPAKIAANRKIFMEQQPKRTEPKFTGPNRYHLDPEIASKYNKFSPGVISDKLQEALGLTPHQLPSHIYKMRLYGYPPGWLEMAKQVQSGVSVFDKTGKVTLITGECLEDGELDEEGVAEKSDYDVNKIIEYPGFTVPTPLGVVDDHASHKMPPIQDHQLKSTLMSQNPEKPRKRKREKDQEEKKKEVEEAKKAKESTDLEEGEGEEMPEAGDTQPMEEDPDQSPQEAKTPLLNKSSSTISLSRDFGTPILVRHKSDLPDASKFSVGIEDHINFENLPDSTGTFEKMRNLIDVIRKKVKH